MAGEDVDLALGHEGGSSVAGAGSASARLTPALCGTGATAREGGH